MSSGLTAIWRVQPLRLGRSTRPRPYHAAPRFRAGRPQNPASEVFTPPRKIKYRESEHVKQPTSSRSQKEREDKIAADITELEAALERSSQKEREDKIAAADITELEAALKRSNFATSVLVPRPRIFGNARQKHRLLRDHHKGVTRQLVHEGMRKFKHANPADWREVLEAMARATPEESRELTEDGIKIEIATDVLERIMRDAGDGTFGAIRRRTGASIKVAHHKSQVLLSGTREEINRATEEFKNIARKITVTRQYRPLSAGEEAVQKFDLEKDFFIPPLSRDEGLRFKKQRTTQHVFSMPVPTEFTPETLRDHVLSVVDTYLDPSLHSVLYPSVMDDEYLDHERAIVKHLLHLFAKLSTEISCSVVKMVLSHMSSKGDKYAPNIRSLFHAMWERSIPMDIDVYNIMLRAHVRTNNLRHFRNTTDMMIKRGFAPNLESWLLFLRLFESVDIKSIILQVMSAKNMLGTNEAIQRIGEEMAALDADHAAVQGKSLETFLQEQEERYGSAWLTRDAGNKILHVFGLHRRYEDACELLDLMGVRYSRIPKSDTQARLIARPDSSSFTAIINRAWVNGNLSLAVNVVRKMRTIKLAQQPKAQLLELLFKLAWRTRLRTTITVIWRYAALARLTTYNMRRLVDKLLAGELGGAEDWKMTEDIYRRIGGETLAHELVGGREVLEQMKKVCMFRDHIPPGELGAIAAKMLPVAFENHGPAIALGTVLSQSVLVDYKCLRARKGNRLRDLLMTAKVKSLPLWPRKPYQAQWADLSPSEDVEPGTIRHDDVWKEEWDSEGWEAEAAPLIRTIHLDTASGPNGDLQKGSTVNGQQAGIDQADGNLASASQFEQEHNTTMDTESLMAEARRVLGDVQKKLGPLAEKRMVMINPYVWDDESHGVSTEIDSRTPLQRENEQACLKALEELSRNGSRLETREASS